MKTGKSSLGLLGTNEVAFLQTITWCVNICSPQENGSILINTCIRWIAHVNSSGPPSPQLARSINTHTISLLLVSCLQMKTNQQLAVQGTKLMMLKGTWQYQICFCCLALIVDNQTYLSCRRNFYVKCDFSLWHQWDLVLKPTLPRLIKTKSASLSAPWSPDRAMSSLMESSCQDLCQVLPI